VKERNSKQKLIALAVAAAVLMNIPILETVNKPILLLGFPLLYFYLFLVWLIIIVVLFWLSRRNPS
jgi:hypothetical protein